jgi:hypothetical protein
MEHLNDPQEYVGETVNVTPQENDDFGEFTGKVTGVRHGFLQVRDQDDAVHEVAVGQVTVVPEVPERSVPPSETELMGAQTAMLRQDGKSWEEIALLYAAMLVEEREEQARAINQKNRAEELLRAKQATEGRTMKPVCPNCGEVDSMDEIDRVAVLQKVTSVTAEGKIELVDETGEVDWECQYPRDNPPEFECGECGEKCSEDALVKATHKAKS